MNTTRALFFKIRAIFCKILTLFLYFQKRARETSPLPLLVAAAEREEIAIFLCRALMIKDIYLMMDLRHI